MTKKHFIAVARDFAAARRANPESAAVIDALAESMADTFASLNGNFQRSTFLDACKAAR